MVCKASDSEVEFAEETWSSTKKKYPKVTWLTKQYSTKLGENWEKITKVSANAYLKRLRKNSCGAKEH